MQDRLAARELTGAETPPQDADAILTTPADWLRVAGNRTHLQREKALSALESALKIGSPGDAELQELRHGVFAMVKQEDAWEQRLGGFCIAKVLVQYTESADFTDQLIAACLSCLEDTEVRVRLAVGVCLGALAAKEGIRVWERCENHVLRSILVNFDRDALEQPAPPKGAEGADGDEDEEAGDDDDDARSTVSSSSAASYLDDLLASSYRHIVPGTGEMRHDTEGWKCLETSYKALQHVMEGSGAAFKRYITDDFRKLLYTSLGHKNRFVRETGNFILESVCQLLNGDPQLEAIAREVAEHLRIGLSDNWSQVRFAASVATRAFMQAAGPFRETVYPLLLPPMCLNRYYLAEGVRMYNQATWALVMGQEGRTWVARYAPGVVEYYIQQSRANNHAVREAACACMAEFMTKVDKSAAAPHVRRMLTALLSCFKDASWPVRDAACLACGKGVAAYPEESRQVLDELYALWLAHLSDNIPSVRQDSAAALADCVRAYGPEALDRLLPALRELLPAAKQQAAESQAFSGLENVTRFGVAGVRRAEDDVAKFSNQQMFSCGSLAPKFSTSVLKRGGGCVDHGFSRPKEPWESSDGAVHLLRQLSEVAPGSVPEFLPTLADVSRLDHFIHAHNLQETVWQQLPAIARNIGKKELKPHLELFLEPLFRSLRGGHRNCQVMAGECLGALRDLLGPNIFAGRLTPEQQQAMASDPNVPPPAPTYAPATHLPATR